MQIKKNKRCLFTLIVHENVTFSEKIFWCLKQNKYTPLF